MLLKPMFVVGICVSVQAFCPAGRAAEPGSAPRGIGRLLPLDSKELPVEFALQAIDEDGFSFSASKQKELQFELFLRSKVPGSGEPGAMRVVAEKCDDSFSLTIRDHRGGPFALYRNRRIFWLAGDAGWRESGAARWGFPVDAEHFGKFFDAGRLAPDQDHDFSLDLPGALKWLIDGQAQSAAWDAWSRNLTIVKTNGSIVHLRFRSPDDQAHYGFVWSEASFRNESTQFTILGFTNRRTDFFSTTAGSKEIRATVQATDPGEEGPPTSVGEVRLVTGLLREAAFRMEGVLGSAAYGRAENKKHREVLLVVLRNASEIPNKATARERNFAVHLVAGVYARVFRKCADQLAAELPHFPDDPVLIRREAEARFGANLLDMQVRGIIVKLLESDILLDSVRDDLCDALGDLGKPIGVNIDLPLEPIRKDPFLDAILRAHWLEPCGKEQIDACVKALKEAEAASNTEYVAAETLLRMDAWDEIPPAVAERWWKKFITDAAAPERTRSLTLVTQHARGRDRLAGQLKAGTLPREVARDAAKALLRRVGAVEKTRRWESIDEETCRVWRKEFTPLAE